MSNLNEFEKVTKIYHALENCNGPLYLRNLENEIGEIKVIRKGFGSELGRPDVLIWIEISFHIFGSRVHLRVPILVEAEEAGISAAKDDFELFFKREKLQIPMVVVAGHRAPKVNRQYPATANDEVSVHQVGFDRVID
jgi:hypothetical protein